MSSPANTVFMQKNSRRLPGCLFLRLFFVCLAACPFFAFAQMDGGMTLSALRVKSRLELAIENARENVAPDEAIAHLEKLYNKARQQDMTIAMFKALGQTGLAYLDKNDFVNAKRYLHKTTLLVNNKKMDNRGLLASYGNLSYIYNTEGQLDSAIMYYLKGVDIGVRYGLKEQVAKMDNTISMVFVEIRDFERAIFCLNRSIQIGLELNDQNLIAGGYLALGMVTCEMADSSDSLMRKGWLLFDKAMAIAGDMPDLSVKRKALNARGVYCLRRKDYLKAIDYFEQAMTIKGGQHMEQTIMLSNLSMAYCHIGNYKQTVKTGLLALDHARRFHGERYLSEIHATLAYAYQQQQQFKTANEHYEEYIHWKKALRTEDAQNNIFKLRFQNETAQKDKELIGGQLKIAQQQAQIDKNHIVTLALVAISLLSAFSVWLYFRYRYRIQRQSERQIMEIAAWKAYQEGEEKERGRLAKNLHDNIGGHLSTLKMWLATIQGHMEQGHNNISQEYKGALDLLDQTLTEVRNTAHHLMPELLLRLGLAESIRVYCSNIKLATGMDVQYQYIGYIDGLDRNIELLIYRMIQELIQNVVKHAQANYLLVQLAQFEQLLTITVEDNGRGMNLHAPVVGGGIGIQNMRNSVEKMNGKIQIHSEPMEGTTVEIELNLAREYRE